MRSIICTFVLLCSCPFLQAQIKAITNTGDEVMLYEDGTWRYTNDSLNLKQTADTSKVKFETPVFSNFLVKSTRIGMGVYIDPKKWTFNKSEGTEPSEYEFEMRDDKNGYAMMITEKLELPMEALKMAAYQNALSVSSDIKIEKEEYRKVNGTYVLMMQMGGKIKGIDFVYLGYYYSSEKGTIQLLTYTFRKLLDENREEMENLLNGLVVLPAQL